MFRLFRILIITGSLALAHAAWGAIPPLVVAPEIEIVRAEFGVFGAAGSDDPAFIQTDQVPYRENQSYGWVVLLKTNKSRIRWREELTLPASPATWGAQEEPHLRTISPDRRTARTEREVTPDEGMIFNAWRVAPGDPAGRYQIRLIIEESKELHFDFEVR